MLKLIIVLSLGVLIYSYVFNIDLALNAEIKLGYH
jgi:hypothetical protein